MSPSLILTGREAKLYPLKALGLFLAISYQILSFPTALNIYSVLQKRSVKSKIDFLIRCQTALNLKLTKNKLNMKLNNFYFLLFNFVISIFLSFSDMLEIYVLK